jgi:hypothetical protein
MVAKMINAMTTLMMGPPTSVQDQRAGQTHQAQTSAIPPLLDWFVQPLHNDLKQSAPLSTIQLQPYNETACCTLKHVGVWFEHSHCMAPWPIVLIQRSDKGVELGCESQLANPITRVWKGDVHDGVALKFTALFKYKYGSWRDRS